MRGAAIVAPNHKSFLDAFVVGISTHRHVRFMAKTELMRGPLGWLFVWPVVRSGRRA
jgi:1-acyl-sn-glycerol-3-phosphate acyltransferase